MTTSVPDVDTSRRDLAATRSWSAAQRGRERRRGPAADQVLAARRGERPSAASGRRPARRRGTRRRRAPAPQDGATLRVLKVGNFSEHVWKIQTSAVSEPLCRRGSRLPYVPRGGSPWSSARRDAETGASRVPRPALSTLAPPGR